MPMNTALNDIIKKKLLDVGGLNPDEIKVIMEAEAKMPSPMIPPVEPGDVNIPKMTPLSQLPPQSTPGGGV